LPHFDIGASAKLHGRVRRAGTLKQAISAAFAFLIGSDRRCCVATSRIAANGHHRFLSGVAMQPIAGKQYDAACK
jgi:hypothetical protein